MAAAEFSAAVRARVNALQWAPHLSVNPSIFRAPTASDWAQLTKNDVRPSLPFSTIHGVKGLQFPAVALVLPSTSRGRGRGRSQEPTALDHWENDTAAESRRVLYVGVSRAQRLLMLVIPDDHKHRVIRLLTRDAVPFNAA
ncbi:3'-5' exonuclease [Streptomyces sp. NPDC001530]|uniref:3'-5' exonuclease n=1 Tax=Streptomyces sp. NPDC001530 TaxID=3364582 RepID=UPI003696FBD2